MNLNHNDCWYKDVCLKRNTNECTDICNVFYELLHLFKYSGLPENLWKPITFKARSADIDAYNKLSSIRNNINAFVNSGRSVYIWSNNSSNGKTSWAVKLLQNYFTTVYYRNGLKPRGFFITTPAYINDRKNIGIPESDKMVQIKNDDGDSLLTPANLSSVDLIVWDDVSNTQFSKFDYANFLSIIEQRNLRNKCNIYTSSVSPDKLRMQVGDSLANKIFKNCEIIEFRSPEWGGDAV